MLYDIKNIDLTIKETFNIGFRLYRVNIKAIVALAILVYIPVMLLDGLVTMPSIQDLLRLLGINSGGYYAGLLAVLQVMLVTDINSLPMEIMGDFSRLTFIIISSVMIAQTVFMPLLASGQTFLVGETIEGKGATAESMMSVMVANIPKTAFTAMLSFMCVMLGTMMLFVPGIYLAICFSFVTPAVIITGKWGFAALKESFLVVRGQWFKTLAFIVLTNVFALMILQMVIFLGAGVFSLFPPTIISGIVVGILGNIVMAYFIMVECLWFVNKYTLKTNIRKSDITA